MAAAFTQPITFDSYRRQYFSLPFGIISYITENPHSAEGLLKIQKTCKYFFAKNSIIVTDEEIYHEKTGLHCFFNQKTYKALPMGKYWFNNLTICDYDSFNLFKHFYRFNLQRLILCSSVFSDILDMSFSELNFLLSGLNVKTFALQNVTIRDEKGALVTIDRILAKLPNIIRFDHLENNQIFTNETFRTMNSLVFNSKFRQFQFVIRFIQPDIDFSLLCDFIKRNSALDSEFYVLFECENPQYFVDMFQTIAKNQITSTIFEGRVSVKFDVLDILAGVTFEKASSNVE